LLVYPEKAKRGVQVKYLELDMGKNSPIEPW
jgi:hypothetical protein